MQYIETLHIRAYSKNKRDEAAQAFHGLRPILNAQNLLDIRCFRDVQLSTDLIISLTWTGALPHRGRSHLGRQLKETFSQFGLINRITWMEENVKSTSQKTINQKTTNQEHMSKGGL